MTDSRGWKKRDDYRLADTGRRARKNRKSNQKKAIEDNERPPAILSTPFTEEEMALGREEIQRVTKPKREYLDDCPACGWTRDERGICHDPDCPWVDGDINAISRRMPLEDWDEEKQTIRRTCY